MTNYRLKWVKLRKYVEESGEGADAVRARVRRGIWLDGRECKKIDGNLWINLEAVDEWRENWTSAASIPGPTRAAGAS